VEHPALDGSDQRLPVVATNRGVATSGDYRNFRIVEGRRISHIIDPRSGRPVSHAVASVTVVAATSAQADAWATALLVLGRDDGLAIARRLGLAAYFIERTRGEFLTYASPAFEQYLTR
jgi:thiamine biosynthesis lipoprotein